MSGVGRPGTGMLKVDGKEVDTKKMAQTLPMILQWDESFDIGSDTLTGVNDADYKPPFALTGKLNKLTLKVDRPKLSPEDIKKLEGAEVIAVDGTPLTRVPGRASLAKHGIPRHATAADADQGGHVEHRLEVRQ